MKNLHGQLGMEGYLNSVMQAHASGQPEELRIDDGEILDVSNRDTQEVKSYLDGLSGGKSDQEAEKPKPKKDESYHGELAELSDPEAQAEVDLSFVNAAESAADAYNRLRSSVSDTLQQTQLEGMSFDELAQLRDICERQGYPAGVSHVSVNYALQAAAAKEGGQ